MTINLYNITYPFDAVLINPPFSTFSDNQNKKANAGNYPRCYKRLYLEFIDKSLELAKQAIIIAPVGGWFVGKNKDRYLERYKKQGLYLIEDKGTPFEGVVTGAIGAFHFNKDKEFIRDEFAQDTPLKNSIVDQYKMYTMVGERTPGDLKDTLLGAGKYKVILTSTKIHYTNDNNLFKDRSRGNWRVVFNHNGNKGGNSIYGGKVQVAGPSDYLSKSSSCFIVGSEEEAQNVCEYLMSDEITSLMREVKVSATNSKWHMSFIPKYVKGV